MTKKAVFFEFTSYTFEPGKKRILFNYKTEFNDGTSLLFTETVLLPAIPKMGGLPKGLIDSLLKSLHIILGISYYKFYCATKVRLPYALSKKEADFWNTVYSKGLGEFFYNNKLDPKRFSPQFPYSKATHPVPYFLEKNNRCLIGVGGGKDSIVAVELLKEQGFDIDAFFIQTGRKPELVDNVIKAMGIKEQKIQRFLDDQAYVPHQYNGHIPISAIYAFFGVLTAVLYNYSYVIVGNEYSSNFGNTTYKGHTINHQWSKSFEFEKIFQEYVAEFISPDVFYFSLLRPFYEIRIVKMFSEYRKYFPVFSSCNKNFAFNKKSKTLWCLNCPKCIFAFILLSAFLPKKDLMGIFKKNLYQDAALLPLFKDVLGFGAMKPFDCVGTFQEAQAALYLAKKKYGQDFIMRRLGHRAKYYPEVFKAQKGSLVPEIFKFLGMEKVLLLGYGKEGKVTQQYLKKYYPKLKIGIADEKQGKQYLKKQKDFDIAVKTPGINKQLVTIPHTTATNIFFSKVLGKNTIIGVTGSKGKSTTASLIFAILKEAGKNVRLVGNIGHPMLAELMHPIKKDALFVVELSSYQLDDVAFSPDIAVVTNLFPEHMDYHGGLENYYDAKKNIIRFQNKNNSFVYHPKNKEIKKWLKGYHRKAVPMVKDVGIKDNDIPLIGAHNKDNIRLAVTVARLCKVSDPIIKKAVINFKGLPHRLERVGEYGGITFYDDAISTTPESSIMAIKALKNVDTILLGGQDRGYDFSALEKTIKKYNIKNAVLFPESGNRMLKKAKGMNTLKTSSMEKAVKFAYKHTKPGRICLLSCASPSYSLWKNFEEKGDEFKKLVKKFSSR
ncbi:MAG: UDP-N-acetylmuramoylalanine--D-glutamate ligase [Candidatus Staskawiczbacteria bacterium RIFCSPLOWO2_01_FULL_40_39]|nr:MAG: UDP-N-acetylmuramoylalanine--D-glutamate ligase [Candidatus Staskawiczbacteria bacterium RIFCSPLOWO2_01_FULL_40_39]